MPARAHTGCGYPLLIAVWGIARQPVCLFKLCWVTCRNIFLLLYMSRWDGPCLSVFSQLIHPEPRGLFLAAGRRTLLHHRRHHLCTAAPVFNARHRNFALTRFPSLCHGRKHLPFSFVCTGTCYSSPFQSASIAAHTSSTPCFVCAENGMIVVPGFTAALL